PFDQSRTGANSANVGIGAKIDAGVAPNTCAAPSWLAEGEAFFSSSFTRIASSSGFDALTRRMMSMSIDASDVMLGNSRLIASAKLGATRD
ncbi:hypothetical protein ABK046_46655, partial [Streptomyces caeruleatus]